MESAIGVNPAHPGSSNGGTGALVPPASALLVGHGSPDPLARAELAELGHLVEARLDQPLELGVLEFPGLDLPDLDATLARLDPQRPVATQPLLLFDGLHGREDIPALAERAAARFGLKLEVGTSFGRDSRLIDLAVRRLRMLAAGPGDHLLFVGRGSSDQRARDQAREVATEVAERLDLPLTVCYTGISHPLLAEGMASALASGPERVLAFPYLIHTGVLVRRVSEILEPLASEARCALQILPHLGNTPELVDLIAERILGLVPPQEPSNPSHPPRGSLGGRPPVFEAGDSSSTLVIKPEPNERGLA